MICPNCQSFRKPKPIGTNSTIQFRANQQCEDCGCQWTPACPKPAAVIMLLAGSSILLFSIALVSARFFYEHASISVTESAVIAFAAIGFATGLYGVQVLRGKVGRLEIKAIPTPTLEDVRRLPIGLSIAHSPNPVCATSEGRSGMPFTWTFETSVRADATSLKIVEFGCFFERAGKWVFSNYTGRPFTGRDFAEWYNCPEATLAPSVTVRDPNNWSGHNQLIASRLIWYYIATDDHGRQFRGEAMVQLLAQTNSPEK